MPDIERGRLCSIKIDGSDSLPFIIKKDRILFGRSDACEIRIYVDGVASEHCVITFNEEGKGFLKPLSNHGITFLNGELIEKEVSLKHNDVITVVKRSFRFFYPSSSVISPSLSIPCSEENQVTKDLDFVPECSFRMNKKENSPKRVTFGPRLSPEEFDKNLPPASPLRRGSLPGENLKRKVSCSHSDMNVSGVRKNLLKSFPASDNKITDCITYSPGRKLSNSAVVLEDVSCVNSTECEHQHLQSDEFKDSRPLFSEVLKREITKSNKSVNIGKLQEFSSRKFSRKTLKFQNPKRSIFKSPRNRLHPRILAVGSTGHVNSPETIVIYKKRFRSVSRGRNSEKKNEAQRNERSMHHNVYSPRNISDVRNGSEELDTINHMASVSSTSSQEKYAVIESNVKKKCSREKDFVLSSSCKILAASKEKYNKQYGEENNAETKQITEVDTQTESSLFEAVNDVSELDEHNIDKSFKDISNAVLALSDHSNLPINSSASSTDICMNVVKKLALTISVVNAFHMYNRIINDVSNYPLCFPSTSLQTSGNTKCVQKSCVHESKEKVDLARFQDIVYNFFSNSLNNSCDGGEQCVIRSYENSLNSDVTSAISCNRKLKKSCSIPKKKSAHKTGCRSKKITCFHDDLPWINNGDNNIHSIKGAKNESLNRCDICQRNLSSSSYDGLYNTSAVDNNSYCPEASLNRFMMSNCSHDSPLTCVQNPCINELSDGDDGSHHELMNSGMNNNSNVHSEKFMKAGRKSFSGFALKEKFMQLQRKSLSPSYLKNGQCLKNFPAGILGKNPASNDMSVSVNSVCRNLRPRNAITAKAKRSKVSLILKKYNRVSSKKIEKAEQGRKHRTSIIQKYNCTVKFFESSKSEGSSVSCKSLKNSVKRKKDQSALPKVKRRKTDQKTTKKINSEKSNMLETSSKSPSANENTSRSLSKYSLRSLTKKSKELILLEPQQMKVDKYVQMKKFKRRNSTSSPNEKIIKMSSKSQKNGVNEKMSESKAVTTVYTERHRRKNVRKAKTTANCEIVDLDTENISKMHEKGSDQKIPKSKSVSSFRRRREKDAKKRERLETAADCEKVSLNIKNVSEVNGKRVNEKIPEKKSQTPVFSPRHKAKTIKKTRSAINNDKDDSDPQNISEINGENKCTNEENNDSPKEIPSQRVTRSMQTRKVKRNI